MKTIFNIFDRLKKRLFPVRPINSINPICSDTYCNRPSRASEGRDGDYSHLCNACFMKWRGNMKYNRIESKKDVIRETHDNYYNRAIIHTYYISAFNGVNLIEKRKIFKKELSGEWIYRVM